MTFSDLKLIKPLIAALDKKGYTQPTPIQEQSIPHVLEGKDVFGCAQTGTGKTAAFALPLLQKLSNKKENGSFQPGIKGLILAPTRELALQISESLMAYGQRMGISHITVFGGVSQHSQVAAMRRGVDIV